MSGVYAIGPFRLHAQAGVLAYGDAPAPLGRRGVAVLTVLVERAPEFVAKEQILDLAWPGVIVEENNLATQISAIRRTLAQAPDGDSWIETLARRGYRFAGPVTPVTPLAPGASAPGLAARTASAGAQEWERRHLALLQVRLRTAPGLDVSRTLAEIVQLLRRFGGQVEEARAAGLLAVFGLAPIDNTPEPAAQAALQIQRVCTAAGVDAVVALDADHLLVRPQRGGFEIAEPGRAALRGRVDALVAPARAGTTRLGPAVLPFLRRRFAFEPGDGDHWLLLARELAAARSAPFVGRDVELARLAEASALAAQGQAQVVGVVGDAGVGKSRLARECVARLPGWLVLEGACAPYAAGTPYFALAQALKSHCGVQDTDGAEDIRAKLARAVPAAAGDPAWLLPALFDVLGVLGAADASRAVDPALRRQRTHDALRQLLLASSVDKPLCLIVHDLQWIDVETRGVLDGLVNSMPRSRLLLLTVYRPEFQHGWGSRASYRQIHLDALNAPHTAALLDALWGTDPGLAPVKRSLTGQGNPFYLEEISRSLVETGTLQGTPGEYQLRRPFEAPQVPPTVQAILAARLDRLAPEDRRLLQIASTIDKDVPLALLQAIADRPEESLRRGLEALQATDFLQQTGLYPNLSFSFRHALTHEVTYGSLPAGRRRALHARIVGAIELAYPDRLDGQADALAHHAVQGELLDKALLYLRQAGQQALARAGNCEAAAFFDEALAALEKLPPTPVTREQAIDLRFDLRTALVPLGQFERIFAVLREAESLADALGDRRRLAEACGYLCHVLWMSGRLNEGLPYGERAQSIAESLGDLPLQVMGNLQLGATLAWMGGGARAEGYLTRALQLLDGSASARRFSLADASAVAVRAYLSQMFAAQGRFDEGVVRAEEAIRLATELERAFDLRNARLCLVSVLMGQGEYGLVIELLEPQQAARGDAMPTIFSARAAGALGCAYAHVGRLAEGLAMLEQALRDCETMRYGVIQLHVLLDLGKAYVLGGRHEDALDCARRALAMSSQSGRRPQEAASLHLRGRALLGEGRVQAAARDFARAQELAGELGLRPLVAHCHAELGRIHRRAGRTAAANAQLATAQALYAQMGMRAWAQRAASEAAETDSPSSTGESNCR